MNTYASMTNTLHKEEDDTVCLVGRDNNGEGKGAFFSYGMFGHRASECSNKRCG